VPGSRSESWGLEQRTEVEADFREGLRQRAEGREAPCRLTLAYGRIVRDSPQADGSAARHDHSCGPDVLLSVMARFALHQPPPIATSS
jgi:hypothetical protein